MGGFDLAKMPAIEGIDLGDLGGGVDVDLGGVVGADLLAFFRVTFADEGRFMWIEPDPVLLGNVPPAQAGGQPQAAPPGPAASSSAPARAPAPAPAAAPAPAGSAR
jgi:hypothetical protein